MNCIPNGCHQKVVKPSTSVPPILYMLKVCQQPFVLFPPEYHLDTINSIIWVY